jgi:hypothetical protein
MSIHTPERLSGESFTDYKARRAASNAANKANRQIGQGGVSSRKQFRDAMRANGTMGRKVRVYVALTAAWAAKRVVKWDGERDEHGAFTRVGRDPWRTSKNDGSPRHKWLAGISAQRGY